MKLQRLAMRATLVSINGGGEKIRSRGVVPLAKWLGSRRYKNAGSDKPCTGHSLQSKQASEDGYRQ